MSRTDETPCLVASALACVGAPAGGGAASSGHTQGVCCCPRSVTGQRLNRSPCQGLCCPPGREGPLSLAAVRRVFCGGGGSRGCPRRRGLSLTLLLPAGGAGAGQGRQTPGDLCAACAPGGPCRCCRSASEPALLLASLLSAGSQPRDAVTLLDPCALSLFCLSVWSGPFPAGEGTSAASKDCFSLCDLTPRCGKRDLSAMGGHSLSCLGCHLLGEQLRPPSGH